MRYVIHDNDNLTPYQNIPPTFLSLEENFLVQFSF